MNRSTAETARPISAIHHVPTDRETIPPNEGLLIAQRLRAERRLRDKAFEPFVLEGGAWEILLDVYIHVEQGISMPVSGAYLEAGVTSTTALRRIAEMEAADMLLRTPDPNDRRRSFLSLSNHTMASMRRYLSMLVSGPSAVVATTG